MNQTEDLISLRDFTDDDHPYGNEQGKATFQKLLAYVEARPQQLVFGISLKDIKHTDASFPRESVISLAKYFRGEHWFYLRDISNRDLLDNWVYAAKAKEQPLVVWFDGSPEIIGVELPKAADNLTKYILRQGQVTAAKVAGDLDISVQNASTQLKKLANQGVVMRSEATAETGGIEYVYQAAR